MIRSLSTLLLIFLCPLVTLGADRPNIVFILADDLGWSDTTLYGTTRLYRTPNIERLARRGMTFTRAYSASPLCSPTRASILTGLAPARHGITSPTCHLPQVVLKATPGKTAPPDQKAVPVTSATRLRTDLPTLPKSLKGAGYATGHFGKWHLGHEPYSPLQHGFVVDLPHHPGPGPAGSYVAPWKFKDFDHDPDLPDQHIEDRMAHEAVRWMTEHKDEPFFLNYWMFSVHAPFDAKSKLIEKYRSQIDAKDPQRSPTYAAMIESMDDAVGTILDAVDRLKIADRTIIVFASDNGGNMYDEVDGTTPTSNAPLRGGKATMYEGGVRGPCVVAWPNVVKAGSKNDSVIQSCDFYPTLLEATGVSVETGQSFDGISIVPALKGETLKREAIFTYFPHAPRVPDWLPPAASVHRGDWKLIRLFNGGEDGAHAWRLFNLQNDPGEKSDLADRQPERVKTLDALIGQHLNETKAVRPKRNPNFDPSRYRPELIGQSRRKTTGRPKNVTKPAAGWTPGRQCRLAVRGGDLVVTSTGGDPYASFQLPRPLPAGKYTLEFTLSSTGSGRGQFFWQSVNVKPAFHRERSVTFEMTHKGQSHDYRIAFSPEKTITAVRLDPGQAKGEIRISSMRLWDGEGQSIYEWKFATREKAARPVQP
jgi:arylsulfatase A-like enzyme